jgi:hypothetical protein
MAVVVGCTEGTNNDGFILVLGMKSCRNDDGVSSLLLSDAVKFTLF